MAAVVKMYPKGPSIGITIPTKLTNTSGKRQYPRTLALLVNVNVLLSWPFGSSWPPAVGSPGYPEAGAYAEAACVGDGEPGPSGDIKERIMCNAIDPINANP